MNIENYGNELLKAFVDGDHVKVTKMWNKVHVTQDLDKIVALHKHRNKSIADVHIGEIVVESALTLKEQGIFDRATTTQMTASEHAFALYFDGLITYDEMCTKVNSIGVVVIPKKNRHTSVK